MAKPRLALVVQRYGEEVVGGAELHCRHFAERLKPDFDVEVLTSCARDYLTWDNVYPEGLTTVNGVKVRRFASSQPRHPDLNQWWERWRQKERTLHEEVSWLIDQGPVLPGLLSEIVARRQEIDLFIFFTYLYFPTAMGLRLVADRSILVPTANPKEDPLYLSCFRELFHLPRAMVYCTDEERDHVHHVFGNDYIPHEVIGVGFDRIRSTDPASFRQKFALPRPYLLFLGRIGKSKGCDTLLAHFQHYLAQGGVDFDLVLAGCLEMEIPNSPFIHFVGTLEGQDKSEALAGAEAVVCPSPWDCLSMQACEAWSAGRPIMVTQKSPVVSSMMARARGGVSFGDAEEFVAVLQKLAKDPAWGKTFGENGQRFVEEHYSWETVLSKLHGLIERHAAVPRC